MGMHNCISKFNDPNERATNLNPYPFFTQKKRKYINVLPYIMIYMGFFTKENDGKDRISAFFQLMKLPFLPKKKKKKDFTEIMVKICSLY